MLELLNKGEVGRETKGTTKFIVFHYIYVWGMYMNMHMVYIPSFWWGGAWSWLTVAVGKVGLEEGGVRNFNLQNLTRKSYGQLSSIRSGTLYNVHNIMCRISMHTNKSILLIQTIEYRLTISLMHSQALPAFFNAGKVSIEELGGSGTRQSQT
jgi:hypothetical protein